MFTISPGLDNLMVLSLGMSRGRKQGVAFTLQAAVLFGSLGYFAGTVGQGFARWPAMAVWFDRLAGLIFCGLGARLIWLL